MKETILYYPTISIPSGDWLRQAILYWDEIGSIVPQRYDETALNPYTPEIQYLKDEGEFRPFRTDLLFERSWEVVQDFEKDLVDTVLSDEFQRKLPPLENRVFTSQIHKEKINYEVFNFLADAGLAIEHRNLGDWYYFENRTALLYMSILAKFLAAEDSQHTISGTNFRAYNDLNFGAKSNSEITDALSLSFLNSPYAER